MAHKHPVYDTDKHFVIDSTTKKISTECPKVALPQHSHRSERFTFEIPKEVEGHDMSLCNVVEIHFQNIEAANKSNKNIGVYKVDDLKAEGETVFGSWLIDGESTYYVGGLIFAMHFACVADDGTIEYNLPTLSYSNITIGETVWNSETIAKEHPDIIAQFEARIQALEKGGVSDEKIAKAIAGYLAEHPISSGSTATIGVANLLAANWVGEGNLYSQIVSIEGVTENSQVDLTPSVEQLVIFYQKDLSFVTEQENGVVTVYAIGQKPENDYTVQVTITEVAV
jgi:hypothetical protein